MSTLGAALTELARVPPKDFTRTRTALVARLRDAGDVKAAARVKGPRAPTISVWAVNRLAQDAEDDVDALISASQDLKAAQLGRRAQSESLGRATRARRAALDRLLRRARSLLQEVGAAASHHLLLRIQMLLTALADPQARRALREGQLERELAAPGFAVFGAAQPTPTGGERKRSGAARPPSKAPRSPTGEPSEAGRAADARRRDREEQRRHREAQRQQRLADAQATMDVAQAGAVAAKQQAADAKQALDALLDAAAPGADATACGA